MKTIFTTILFLVSLQVSAQSEQRYPNIQKIQIKPSQICTDYFGITIVKESALPKKMFCSYHKEIIAYFETNDPHTQHQYGIHIPELNIDFDDFSWIGGRPYDYDKRMYLDNAYEYQKAQRVNAFYEKIWKAVKSKVPFTIEVEGHSKTLLDVK